MTSENLMSNDQIRQFLLTEFRLTPKEYKVRFDTASKSVSETLFASRLGNLLQRPESRIFNSKKWGGRFQMWHCRLPSIQPSGYVTQPNFARQNRLVMRISIQPLIFIAAPRNFYTDRQNHQAYCFFNVLWYGNLPKINNKTANINVKNCSLYKC